MRWEFAVWRWSRRGLNGLGFSQSGTEDGTFEGERTISLLHIAWSKDSATCCGVNLARDGGRDGGRSAGGRSAGGRSGLAASGHLR